MTPGDAQTSTNPTCSAHAKLTGFYISEGYDFVLVYVFTLQFSFCDTGEAGMGPAPVLVLGS